MPQRGRPGAMFWVFWLLGATLLAFIALPLLALVLHPTLADLVQVAALPDVRAAIALSLAAAFVSTAIVAVFALPLAYLLARQQFRGKSAVETLVDLPLTIPHTIAGIALLLVFSRGGWLGAPLARLGLDFWGSFAGIVLAMAYVGLPYAVNAARGGFEAVDAQIERAARIQGARPWSVFTRITLPLSRSGIVTGLTLCFARAIGEFAAVVLLAYYPMTAPIRIYDLFLQSGLRQSVAASVLFLATLLGLFWLVRLLASPRRRDAPPAAATTWSR
ncbi:MAG: ABC transporter permease [Burkholderiales bacterium]|nr:ABC transporter permease [Burkholderiales bacterium]